MCTCIVMCVLIIFIATLSNCWDSTFMYIYDVILLAMRLFNSSVDFSAYAGSGHICSRRRRQCQVFSPPKRPLVEAGLLHPPPPSLLHHPPTADHPTHATGSAGDSTLKGDWSFSQKGHSVGTLVMFSLCSYIRFSNVTIGTASCVVRFRVTYLQF